MLFLVNEKTSTFFWTNKPPHIADAKKALLVQADGHELEKILEEIPSLDTGERVQRFYGQDAVKAALTLCQFP